MANLPVQTKSATVDNFGSSTTLSFNTTPTVGRAIVVCIAMFGADVTSITDNQGGGNSYALAIGAQSVNSSSTRNFIFRCDKINTSSGTFTITLNTSGTGNYCLWSIVEESGGLDTSSLDKTASAETAAGTSVTPTTAATTQADEIAYVVVGGSNNGGNPHGYALPGTYTQIYKEDNAAVHHAGIFGYRVLTATAVQNPAVTWTAADTGLGVIATFKAAASGSTTTVAPAGAAVTINGRAPIANAFVTPAAAPITISGRTPATSAFQNVRIRQVLVNEGGQAVANAANITLLVWYGGVCRGAPDISVNGQTTDANGTTSWSIATGTLGYQDKIFYVAQDSLSFSNYTCARLTPNYE